MPPTTDPTGPLTHLVLVGLSGTGKSTVAPLLAERRGVVAVDLDRLLEQRFGRPVAQVFLEDGEPEFRRAEAELLAEVLVGPPAVIATGGGAVLDPESRRRLADAAFVVWLSAPIDLLVRHLSDVAERRPLLADDPATALRAMAAERDPLYREVADLVVDVERRSPEEIAEMVADVVVVATTGEPSPTTDRTRGAR
ncbi:MAG TPA: shikimate kinase [Microthrixaceae bacterium]|nr:shikimate kinase [Microthrixaceae bacterium]HNE75639.1 shikimate kinase [Microthrixaceae bacterium]HNG23912.1 shikimate kinase [Microthrixaceae bacterium]HNJ23340.1 shikimate kinase [Microthrixaceae bacterium]HNK39135.1 shikimate kinase [Microthrixaceae bacterium]